MSLSMISWPRHAPLHRLDSMSVLSTVTFQAIDLPASLGFGVLPSGRFTVVYYGQMVICQTQRSAYTGLHAKLDI